MAWPQSQDYNEAMQNPQFAFGDPELRGGQAVCNTLGIPMPRSGNFADVYEFVGASGQRWALKCFTRQVPGLQERYSAISKHLLQANLPFTVDFTYLAKGMRIRGECYPVLKMQWVEGLLLNEFVRANADKPALLDALTQVWVRMARRLSGANIAHGDLQHGNVILVPGSKTSSLSVKLIDYDGMWVPALAAIQCGEVGHPAYQHPQRLQHGIYSADIDRLPVLAIACALRCLAVSGKSLWDRYDNGDNILFRESDLCKPTASALLKELWKIKDQTAHDLTGYLAIALTGDLANVPPLQDIWSEGRVRPLSALGAAGGHPQAAQPMRPQTLIKVAEPSRQPQNPARTDWNFLNKGSQPDLIIRKPARRGFRRVLLCVAALCGLGALTGLQILKTRQEKTGQELIVLVAHETKENDPPGIEAALPPLPTRESSQPERPAEISKPPSSQQEPERAEPDQVEENLEEAPKQAERVAPRAKGNDANARRPLPAVIDNTAQSKNRPVPVPKSTEPVVPDAEKNEDKATEPIRPSAPFAADVLAKKFKGRASYDIKTSTLTLVYDFKSPEQLDDFDTAKAEVVLLIGYMHLKPKMQARHIVKFTEFSLKGKVYVEARGGYLLHTTGGIHVGLEAMNATSVTLAFRKKNEQARLPFFDREGFKDISLKILPTSVNLSFASQHLKITTQDAQAGFITFVGGDEGLRFGEELTLAGKMDDAWARDFFAAPAAPEKSGADIK